MSSALRNRWIALGLVLLTVAFLFLESRMEKEEQLASTTVYGRKSLGISVFMDLVNRLGGKAADWPSSFLERIPSQIKTLAILAPQARITPRESNLIRVFVENGGTLILSGHRPEDISQLSSILSPLSVHFVAKEKADFKNRELVKVTAQKDDPIFKAGETYAFYSLIQFSELHSLHFILLLPAALSGKRYRAHFHECTSLCQ